MYAHSTYICTYIIHPQEVTSVLANFLWYMLWVNRSKLHVHVHVHSTKLNRDGSRIGPKGLPPCYGSACVQHCSTLLNYVIKHMLAQSEMAKQTCSTAGLTGFVHLGKYSWTY